MEINLRDPPFELTDPAMTCLMVLQRRGFVAMFVCVCLCFPIRYPQSLNQRARPEALAVAMDFSEALMSSPGFRLGFNSGGSSASVNHLHFQVRAGSGTEHSFAVLVIVVVVVFVVVREVILAGFQSEQAPPRLVECLVWSLSL